MKVYLIEKKKIKSFQDYNDYIKGINTTVTIYEKR